MAAPGQHSVRNRLLSLMPADAYERLAADLTPQHMPRGLVLAEPDRVIEHIYFPESGIVSMVALSPEGLEVEAGLFGRDGVGSTAPVLGAQSAPNRLNVQVEGNGWRVEREPFLAALHETASLRSCMLLYTQTLIVQTTYTALSNAVHQIDERLARWLLMCDDRCDSGELPLTHEFLSVMLAVRRPSVTTSLHVLEGNGLIRAGRGCVYIRNRAALEQFAGDAYGRPEATYEKLIGPMRERL